MKKTISLILALMLFLSLCACGATPTEPQEESMETPIPTPEPAPIWTLNYLTDDFGDPTDKACVATVVSGTFNNTATTGSNLDVVVVYHPAVSNEDRISGFSFQLIEYGEHPATYLQSDEAMLKIKIGDEITEDYLMGTPPNGDLFILNSGILERNSADVGDPNLSETDGVWECYKPIFNTLLLNQQDIRCIIEIGGSEYSFTLNGNGFEEAAYEMMKAYGYENYVISVID